MKISFTKLQNIWKGVVRSYRAEVNPERDWYLLLVVSSGLLLISALINLIIFFDVYRGASIVGPGTENPPARETQQTEMRLEEIENIFDTRAESFEKILSEPYGFVDPARN